MGARAGRLRALNGGGVGGRHSLTRLLTRLLTRRVIFCHGTSTMGSKGPGLLSQVRDLHDKLLSSGAQWVTDGSLLLVQDLDGRMEDNAALV